MFVAISCLVIAFMLGAVCTIIGICVLETRWDRRAEMPVRKVKGGWKCTTRGKVFPTRAAAQAQWEAIMASGWREPKKRKGKK